MIKIHKPDQVLSKAAITTGSFTSGIGLSQEEADRFLDFVIDESSLKGKVRIERMNTREKLINVLSLAGKVMKPGVEATDPGETVGISTRQIRLQAKETIAIVRISDDAMEDNVEGDAFAEHLLGLIARAAANELEDAWLYGRTGSVSTPTEITQLFKGWIPQVEDGGNIVDAAGAGFSDRFMEKLKLSAAIKAMPTKFRRNKSRLRFGMPADLDQDWSDAVVNVRETALGDQSLEMDRANRYNGVQFDPTGLYRTDRPVLVVGGGSSTLDNNEAIGDTVLEIGDTANFAAADKVVIDKGNGLEEVATIASVQGGTSITLAAPGLQFAHSASATVEEATADGADVLLTEYSNLILGLQRDVRLEPDRLPRLRSTDWVLTMRSDTAIAEAQAAVLLKNLKVK